ncbi:MAG: GTP 3',8-cyclase MoaA [Nitrososphaerota archaeon]
MSQNKEMLVDSYGRVARKLRLSITDRCNFRCNFCMPATPVWLHKNELLTFDEIVRVTTILASLGVDKIKITGGEPLLRRDVDKLVELLAQIPKINSLSMTTNGYYLEDFAWKLRKAGLKAITISLHSLKEERYEKLVGRTGVFSRVLRGIEEAKKAEFNPLKINVVITRGCNDDEILDFVELSRASGLIIKFIEYMPFDGNKIWDRKLVVTGEEIISKIKSKYELIKVERSPGDTAISFKFADSINGGISIITSMSSPFCKDCDRIRITADGKLIPCLFSDDSYDLKSLIRTDASDEEVANFIKASFKKKFRGVESILHKDIENIRPMYTVGG